MYGGTLRAFEGGGVNGGPPCRMTIIRNGNVALSNLRKAPVTLSNLRKAPVACHYGLERAMSPCRF